MGVKVGTVEAVVERVREGLWEAAAGAPRVTVGLKGWGGTRKSIMQVTGPSATKTTKNYENLATVSLRKVPWFLALSELYAAARVAQITLH